MFTKLTHNEPLKSEVLLVNGRKLQVKETARGVALFSFQELCEQVSLLFYFLTFTASWTCGIHCYK
jgi:predicted ATPase